MPLLAKMTDDDPDGPASERELDVTTKIVELAHYLYEICMMKDQMMNMDKGMGDMEYAEDERMPNPMGNPKKAY